MKYFNVKYECLDARDDYSKQQDDKNGHPTFLWRPAAEEYDLGEIDMDENQAMQGADFYVDEDETPEALKYRENFERRLEEIKRIVITSGWLDKSIDGLPEIDLNIYEPDVIQAASKWQAAVHARKEQLIADRNKNMPNHVKNQNLNKKDPFANDVRVVNKKYLDKSYRALTARDQSMIDDTSSTFQLNRDQDRAFHIVANHATEPHSEQLKMYLGGMGGTGKSRVIQALSQFFKDRGESHRFLILAPTGSAAALLNGSTYHSILGINDRSEYERNNSKESAQVRSRLEGVDYIFLDEVSMLSCHNMYQVSAATAKATGNVDEPFGGINMIFAGDFAQLPPVNGAALYSSSVGTQLMSSMHIRSQEETIGKALWHQITTVVILRENMRQRQQTIEDTKLRTALENMRYKACTPDDVAFLLT
jgi:PIF1-like helicase